MALLVPESGSERVAAWRDRLSSEEARSLTSSGWTAVEVASAIGIKVRTRELTAARARDTLAVFTEIVMPHWRMLAIEEDDLQGAFSMLRDVSLGLRSGDALHMAIAQRAQASVLATLDAVQAAAARRLGLATARI